MVLDMIATASFVGLLGTTAVLRAVGPKNTQEFKLYLLLATLAMLACKIYLAVKYYEGVRIQNAKDDPPSTDHPSPLAPTHPTQKLEQLDLPRLSKLTRLPRRPRFCIDISGELRDKRDKRGKGEFTLTYSP